MWLRTLKPSCFRTKVNANLADGVSKELHAVMDNASTTPTTFELNQVPARRPKNHTFFAF